MANWQIHVSSTTRLLLLLIIFLEINLLLTKKYFKLTFQLGIPQWPKITYVIMLFTFQYAQRETERNQINSKSNSANILTK
jgi:hypothetical protein